jgi:hypothetical protein
MTRQQPTDPNRRPRGIEPAAGRSATAGRRAEARQTPTGEREPAGEEWADEAAQARTASDPRRVTPHDRSGVPSTGDAR